VSRLATLLVLGLAVAPAARAAAPPPTQIPDTLAVGVNLPSEGFQVGAAKGSEVVFAQGLEIDLARALAKQLELQRAIFVQTRFDRLIAAGPKPFDLALAQITITPARQSRVAFSIPYMRVDQGVLLNQTVSPVPRTIAALQKLQLCALTNSTGADLIQSRIKPIKPARLIGNVGNLMLSLQTGRCQAVVYDAPSLGTLKARVPPRYGPFAGVIRTGENYGIAMPKGSPLLAPVNAALQALIAQGLIQRLEKRWLSANLSKLPVLG
jgi:polar amino acid transport system substrate-binding protein